MKKFLPILIVLCNSLATHSQISFLPQIYPGPLGYYLACVGIGDFNGDGRPDVITQGYNQNNFQDLDLFIFTQNTDGTLNPAPRQIPYTNGSANFTTYLTAAPMSGDSLTDVIIGTNDSVYIYYQSAAHALIGPSTGIYAGNQVDAMAVADIDSDGYNDIALSFWRDTVIRVFYGTAKHDSFNIRQYPSQSSGFDDLVIGRVGRKPGLAVLKLLGQSGGTIIANRINHNRLLDTTLYFYPPGGFTKSGLTTGDRFGDGNNEIVESVSANQPASELIFYDNPDSSMTIDDSLLVPDIPEELRMADLNCDGKSEIIVAHGGWYEISVVSPDNTLQTFRAQTSDNMNHLDMAVADVTGDGRLDIVVVSGGGNLTVLKNTSPELMDTLHVQNDTTGTDSVSVYASFPPVYQLDTLVSADTTIYKTTTLSINQLEFDSLKYIETTGYGLGLCFGDTLGFTDSSITIVNKKYTFDTTIVSVIYDTVLPTGIQKVVTNNIMVYPSPFNTGVNITGLTQGSDVEVYNETGSLVLRTYCTGSCYIPRKDWAPGLYMITIITNGAVYRQKIVAL